VREKIGSDRPERVMFTGFEARDLFDESIPRESKFLHCAGESEFKNTEAVIQAWKCDNWAYAKPPLTVVTRHKKYRDLCEGAPEITCIERATEDELKQLMNSHRFHVIPAAYEGYGHAIHEGVGCGALVITTDAAPMREFAGIQGDWSVKVASTEVRGLATLHRVSPGHVINSVYKGIEAFDRAEDLRCRSAAARSGFLQEREEFRQRILSMVGVA
jgi:hypothetical protein